MRSTLILITFTAWLSLTVHHPALAESGPMSGSAAELAEIPPVTVTPPMSPPTGPSLPGTPSLGDLAQLAEIAAREPGLTMLWAAGTASMTYFSLSIIASLKRLVTEAYPNYRRWRTMRRVEVFGEDVIAQIRHAMPELNRLGEVMRAEMRATDELLAELPEELRQRPILDAMLNQQQIVASLKNRAKPWLARYQYLAKNNSRELHAHIQNLPEGVAHRTSVMQLPPDVLTELIEKPGMRDELVATPKGAAWLAKYEQRRFAERIATENAVGHINSAIAGTAEFFRRIDKLSHGIFMERDLAFPPFLSQVAHEPEQPGTLRLGLDGGFEKVTSDTTGPLGNELRHYESKCAVALSKLSGHRRLNRTAFIKKTLAPVGLGAGVLAGYSLWTLAHNAFKAKQQKPPDEILQEKKAEDQKKDIQTAFEVQSIDTVAQEFKKARTNTDPPDEMLLEIYKILREEFRRMLTEKNPNFEQNLTDYAVLKMTRKKSGIPFGNVPDPELEQYMRSKAEEFIADDEKADEMIDKALAKAGRDKNGSITPEKLRDTLMMDEKDMSQKELILKSSASFLVEHLWSQLELDATSYMIDTSFFRPLVENSLQRVNKRIEDNKKAAAAALEAKEKANKPSGATTSMAPSSTPSAKELGDPLQPVVASNPEPVGLLEMVRQQNPSVSSQNQ